MVAIKRLRNWPSYHTTPSLVLSPLRATPAPVIVDGQGRIVALLTGGAGFTLSSDITYATPIGPLLKCIKVNGYHHINPAKVPSRNLRTPKFSTSSLGLWRGGERRICLVPSSSTLRLVDLLSRFVYFLSSPLHALMAFVNVQPADASF